MDGATFLVEQRHLAKDDGGYHQNKNTMLQHHQLVYAYER
jgi:hypothetical protein